ncbi:FG-GAP-like repeat-containing protein [Streptomyces sp. HUAS MG47]|uniref:FG-GAP repeat domain-containing protein n=1 Tax=Streptomyces solicamelliae TaxID=3231716 RepID=UPI003877994E
MTAGNSAGGDDLRLVSMRDGKVTERTVTGLPPSAADFFVDGDSSQGTALLRYFMPDGEGIALVDLASGAVVESRDTPGGYTLTDVTASETHIAWTDINSISGVGLSVAPRGSGEAQRTAVGGGKLNVDLLGDWVLYSRKGSRTANYADPLHALTARSLKTGTTLKLLDHSWTILPTPDGALLAEGGTVEHGEGLYRIALGADGTPVVTLAASTGEPTALTLLGSKLPSGVIDLDKTRTVPLEASFSRHNVRLVFELTHVASQRRMVRVQVPYSTGAEGPVTISTSWDGRLDLQQGELGEFLAAYNGDYTWRIQATPMNGIGPAVERTGAFSVVRSAKPHDFSDNGSPDALGIDSTGQLTRYDTAYRFDGLHYWTARTGLGTGWQIYDRLVAAGNVGGTAQADVLARDRSGALWLYEGTGKPGQPLASRKKVGTGWQIYNRITSGGDLTGDGKVDLLATDAAGALWLYKGTGSATAPLAYRVKVGHGWGMYNKIVATGNIAGGPAGDLVARDASGVLWLYPGTGNGTFGSRLRIGSGWGAFAHLLSVGDANRDGRPDLFAVRPDGITYVYEATGNQLAPFKAGRTTISRLRPTPGEFTQLF